MHARPERSVMVLGPPRSGKTTSIVIPAVLSADGPVVSTSTKPEVMRSTVHQRLRLGPCYLYDPSGKIDLPEGVERLVWSPVAASADWRQAQIVSRMMVRTARVPGGGVDSGSAHRDPHWTERAESLLASLLHAAALTDRPMRDVVSWVDARKASEALDVLERGGDPSAFARDLLSGIVATDLRELSGIWSSASGVLGAYRNEPAIASTKGPAFDSAGFCRSRGTVYVCASGLDQDLAAPLIVGLLTDIQNARFAIHSDMAGEHGGVPPVLFALDEVANIAPLPNMTSLASEGGGQGIVTLACLQDLSQARQRWGDQAEGFMSLFGVTVELPGIKNPRTLQAVELLSGTAERRRESVTGPADRPGVVNLAAGLLSGGGRQLPQPTRTVSTEMRPVLPAAEVARGRPGAALLIDERSSMSWVTLTPWFDWEPFRSAVRVQSRSMERDRLSSGSGGREL